MDLYDGYGVVPICIPFTTQTWWCICIKFLLNYPIFGGIPPCCGPWEVAWWRRRRVVFVCWSETWRERQLWHWNHNDMQSLYIDIHFLSGQESGHYITDQGMACVYRRKTWRQRQWWHWNHNDMQSLYIDFHFLSGQESGHYHQCTLFWCVQPWYAVHGKVLYR